MSILPTAHASQRFGGKTIDFYVAPGQVIGSDPRAHANERRIQDLDGERHPVRIPKREFSLEPGDFAAVIRLQPGPKRRSRPVAIINYRTNSWTRTQGEATTLLSKAGVARNTNWLLTMLAFVLVSGVIVWPQLVAMIAILAPGLAAGLPAIDVFALMASLQPGLADARLAEMAPGLSDVLTNAVPQLAGSEGAAIFALGVAGGLLVAFGARSWRFVWVPVFLIGLLAGSVAVAGPEAALVPALLALLGSAVFFLLGGVINRWRDSVRLEARVARLADHVLRHPPQEMVSRREPAPALSDAEIPVSKPAEETPSEDQTPVVAAAGVAAIATAAISARSTDEADASDAEIAGGEAEAAPVTGDQADDLPDLPAEAEAVGETPAQAEDPRHEARSMDIPPPPPMPLPATQEALTQDEADQPVNRDADGPVPGTGEAITDAAEEPAQSPQLADTNDELAGVSDAFGGDAASEEGEAR